METIIVDGVSVFVDKNEKYLQINELCEPSYVFWEQVKANFAEYEAVLCYHNCDVPLEFLDSIGAVIIDDCEEMHLYSANRANVVDADVDVCRVNETDYNLFAALHEKRNPEMFWNSERIRRDLNNWGVFATYLDGQITGYILISLWDSNQAEIFCLEAEDTGQGLALIISATKFAFRTGKKDVLYMVEKDSCHKETALSAGFCLSGQYKGYQVKV